MEQPVVLIRIYLPPLASQRCECSVDCVSRPRYSIGVVQFSLHCNSRATVIMVVIRSGWRFIPHSESIFLNVNCPIYPSLHALVNGCTLRLENLQLSADEKARLMQAMSGPPGCNRPVRPREGGHRWKVGRSTARCFGFRPSLMIFRHHSWSTRSGEAFLSGPTAH